LQQVDYILCEDTRRGIKLKTHYSLKPRLISFHEHNERARIPKILSLMKAGKTFALISDAGSPLLSDPGLQLVKELIKEDIPFTCAPGPSAVPAALLMSGFPVEPFSFLGFLPSSPTARKSTLQNLCSVQEHTLVLFESPQRILGLLREIGEILGDREVAVCRELTKVHEEILRGKISSLVPLLSSRKLQGEFTLVVAPGQATIIRMTEEAILARFAQLQKEGLSRKDALKKLVKESGRLRNELYPLLMK
jgi:16S rRNA (cytidine1402-2'-O)-methyltransferase